MPSMMGGMRGIAPMGSQPMGRSQAAMGIPAGFGQAQAQAGVADPMNVQMPAGGAPGPMILGGLGGKPYQNGSWMPNRMGQIGGQADMQKMIAQYLQMMGGNTGQGYTG